MTLKLPEVAVDPVNKSCTFEAMASFVVLSQIYN